MALLTVDVAAETDFVDIKRCAADGENNSDISNAQSRATLTTQPLDIGGQSLRIGSQLTDLGADNSAPVGWQARQEPNCPFANRDVNHGEIVANSDCIVERAA